MISTTAPLLQRWFAESGHADSGDPYYLYAASNAGSLVALFAYPFLVEPFLSLSAQSGLWAGGYGVLLVLLMVCAREPWRSSAGGVAAASPTKDQPSADPITGWTRARWVVLALVPSSLMLGCTSYLSADVAAVPLMWIAPLALYLLSFIFAFARSTPTWVHRAMVVALPFLLLYQVATSAPMSLGTVATHFATLFVAAMVCHGELARSRPPVQYLTEYYLWIATGGMLGSCLNALIAPLLFNWVIEYPLALAVAAFLLPALFPNTRRPLLLVVNRALPVALGCIVAAIFLWNRYRSPERVGVVHEERTFFGVYRVIRHREEKAYTLMHGRIEHGTQIRSDDPRRSGFPMLYYHPTSPIGQVFFAFQGPKRKTRTAVVGLGIGTLATYGEPGQEFTFFEIDPAVERIARHQRYFTHLSDAEERGVKVRVVLGDARLSLQRDEESRYGMIVVDAFNGDAIPAHLLTREAFELYKDRLEEDGVLAIHITNQYVDLEPIVAELARAHELAAMIQKDLDVSVQENQRGKAGSVWVVLARKREHFGNLNDNPRWTQPQQHDPPILWRDDYTDLWRVLRW
jgi:spermidine synthase